MRRGGCDGGTPTGGDIAVTAWYLRLDASPAAAVLVGDRVAS